MKKGILYLFLFTYSTVMLKPVLPFVTDFFAHILFFKDHMQTVHAHHGKFHAHTAVAEAAKNDQPEKTTNNFKKDNQGNDHLISGYAIMNNLKIPRIYFHSTSVPVATRNICFDYPPPRI